MDPENNTETERLFIASASNKWDVAGRHLDSGKCGLRKNQTVFQPAGQRRRIDSAPNLNNNGGKTSNPSAMEPQVSNILEIRTCFILRDAMQSVRLCPRNRPQMNGALSSHVQVIVSHRYLIGETAEFRDQSSWRLNPAIPIGSLRYENS